MDDRLPYEFIVYGIPKSVQSRRQTEWRSKVASVARERWSGGLLSIQPVRVVIVYYFRDGDLDVDNMIKPILDALKGVIYADDNMVDEVTARKTELTTGLQIAGASAALIVAIDNVSDFVYVKIEEGPDHGMIP